MKTYLITGGTDGMGKQLALRLLKEGDQVVAVGSNPKKGELFLADAGQLGANGRTTYIQANLTLVSENHRIINEVASRFGALDGVVFCAVNFTQRKEALITEEGFEAIFALVYLSRFILSYGLTEALEQSPNPVILNFCAAGMPTRINWKDIQCKTDFQCTKALMSAGKMNDPLGVGYVLNNPSGKMTYVLFNPGMVKTTAVMREQKTHLFKLIYKAFGKSAEKAIEPAMHILRNVPKDKLIAFNQSNIKPISLNQKSFDESKAKELYITTRELLGQKYL
jgi:short-subunit dehydrogenase